MTNLRQQVLHYLGGDAPACACPGCGATENLQIDHVDGGGNAHRYEVRDWTFYRGILDGTDPRTYALLCQPCNASKGSGAFCRLSHDVQLNQRDTSLDDQKEGQSKGRGRPKKNIVKMTVSLTEDNDAWVRAQPGEHSAVVNRLIDQARGQQAAHDTPDSQEVSSLVMGEGEDDYHYLDPQRCASAPTPMTDEPPKPRRSLWGLFRR